MKLRTIIFAALAAAVTVSCAKVAENTEITGTVEQAGVTKVNISVGKIDTLVPVVDGKFFLTVPTDLTKPGTVSTSSHSVDFIADGTKLNVTIGDSFKVTSKSPKKSVHERLNVYNDYETKSGEEYLAKRQEIYSDATRTNKEKSEAFEKYYDEFIASYVEYNIEVAKKNSDNYLAVLALQNLRGMTDAETLNSIIEKLSPSISDNKSVRKIKSSVEAVLATSEGKKFKDFTVNTVYGQTRSIPPQPLYKEVNFSDYVGNGKYVLVDFWSPWCGPCKAEIPNIKAVYEKYKGDKFDVLSIAVWEREPVDVTISTAASLGIDWNQINNAGSVPTEIYGIEGIPHIMLVGPDGTILKRGLRGIALEEAVAEYVK